MIDTTRVLRSASRALAAAIVAVLVIPGVSDGYWLSAWITGAIFVLPVAGCALLYGRIGIVPLFQIALMGVGAWVTFRLTYATGLPFLVVMVGAGLVTSAIGVLVTLPALRLSVLHFALLSLMAAGGAEVFFSAGGFPNGGPGFLGVIDALATPKTMPRPSIAVTDGAYFRYVVAVVIIVLGLIWLHLRGRPGRTWATIWQGDACARSVGIRVELYKVWGVALASFATGIGGACYAAQIGSANVASFTASDSVVLFAVTLVGGAFSLSGALVGAGLAQLLPPLLERLGANANVALVLFGAGLILVLIAAPRGVSGLVEDFVAAVRRRAFQRRPLVDEPA